MELYFERANSDLGNQWKVMVSGWVQTEELIPIQYVVCAFLAIFDLNV